MIPYSKPTRSVRRCLLVDALPASLGAQSTTAKPKTLSLANVGAGAKFVYDLLRYAQ
jgi:hypothetical protein